jgi:hypothetical protein
MIKEGLAHNQRLLATDHDGTISPARVPIGSTGYAKSGEERKPEVNAPEKPAGSVLDLKNRLFPKPSFAQFSVPGNQEKAKG